MREETATFAEFARLLGFKRSYVTELKAAGRLVLTDDGKRVDVEASRRLIRDTADPARAGVAERHAATRAIGGAGVAGEASAPHAAWEAEDSDSAGDLAADPVQDSHTRRRAQALADQAELQRRKMEREERVELGQMLWADDVAQAVRAAGVTLRSALENLPNTIAPQLAATSDEARVRVLLGEAIEHALEELSRQFAAVARSAG